MNRKIVVKDCSQCPHITRGGGFGQISYIPVCRKRRSEELPYTVSTSQPTGRTGSRMTTATVKPGIPEWCPLELN